MIRPGFLPSDCNLEHYEVRHQLVCRGEHRGGGARHRIAAPCKDGTRSRLRSCTRSRTGAPTPASSSRSVSGPCPHAACTSTTASKLLLLCELLIHFDRDCRCRTLAMCVGVRWVVWFNDTNGINLSHKMPGYGAIPPCICCGRMIVTRL